ncbi:MAG: hypothetical protein AB8F26_10640 [Phycisphaerales bacterium]
MLWPIYIAFIAGVFAFNHRLLRASSESDNTWRDIVLYFSCAGYAAYFIWVLPAIGFLDNADPTSLQDDLLVGFVMHGIPTIFSCIAACIAWRDGLPAIGLAIAVATVIAIDMFELPVYATAVLAPFAWNVIYIIACAPVISRLSKWKDTDGNPSSSVP